MKTKTKSLSYDGRNLLPRLHLGSKGPTMDPLKFLPNIFHILVQKNFTYPSFDSIITRGVNDIIRYLIFLKELQLKQKNSSLKIRRRLLKFKVKYLEVPKKSIFLINLSTMFKNVKQF